MLLQDSVEGIEEGRKHASPPDLCTPSALLWKQQALYLLLVREGPGPRGIFDLPIALFSTRILPSQCMTLDQGLGLVQGKAVTLSGSWSSPSPSGYFWVTWRVAGLEQEGPGPRAAGSVPGCIRAAQQAASPITLSYAQRELDSASHLWIPKASGSGRWRSVSGQMRHLRIRARPYMHLKQEEAEAFTEEMDGAAPQRRWASN